MSSSIITIIVSIGAINWFVAESKWAKSKVKDGYKVYSAPIGLKAVYFTGIPLFIYGAILNSIENPGERWVSAILMTFAILGVAFFPATILLSRERAVSVRWFGLRRIEMNWNEVDAIYSNPEDRSIIIQDKKQRRIIHTILNVDHEGFVSELRLLPATVSKNITFQL
jgi:hypothetical protein